MNKKEKTHNFRCVFCVGTYLSSQAAARQVFSAQVSLTSVFGMGTGGPSPQSAPTVSFDNVKEYITTKGTCQHFFSKNLYFFQFEKILDFFYVTLYNKKARKINTEMSPSPVEGARLEIV